MLSDTKQSNFAFAVDARQLSVDRPLLERVLGYTKDSTPEVVRSLIDEIVPLIPDYLGVQCGYTILHVGTVTFAREGLSCNGVQFETGSIIAKRLRKSRTLALFVATIGPKLEQWSRRLISEGDFLRGYIVDAIGSDLVEQAADCLERKIGENVQPLGWKITSRYSPGYCGWSVAEQHKLFCFLPEKSCGVTLTESALMVPIKSVSGVIGLGPNVEREDFECSICDMEDCFRRRNKPEPEAR
jgi:hypothetical protein